MRGLLAGRTLRAVSVVAGILAAAVFLMSGVGSAGSTKGNNGQGVRPLPDAQYPDVCGSVNVSGILASTPVSPDSRITSTGDTLVVRDITFAANSILDWHYHPGPGMFEVTAGSGRYETQFGLWDLTIGAIVTEPPYQVHRLLAGPSGVTIRYSAINRVGFPSTRCVGEEPAHHHANEAQGPIDENLLYPSRSDAGILQILPTP